MNFYKSLSQYYDEIFPAGEADMAFLASRFAACVDILDLGCGTGNKSALLAAPGRRILGLDLDPDMIAVARANNSRPGIKFQVMDMTAAPELLPPASFDGALCLGNSLAHLEDPPAMERFVAGISGLLRPGGLLALQILNYERIRRLQIRELPLLESAGARFERRYEPQGRHLRFITALTVKSSGQRLVNEASLYPLERDELAALLERSGFGKVDWRGGYDGSPLGADSFALIALCSCG